METKKTHSALLWFLAASMVAFIAVIALATRFS